MVAGGIRQSRRKRSAPWPGAFAVALLLAACVPAPPEIPVELRMVDASRYKLGTEELLLDGVEVPVPYGSCTAEIELARRAQALAGDFIVRGPVRIDRRRKDEFGRTLARFRVDGEDLSLVLVTAGVAKPFDGFGRREGFCA